MSGPKTIVERELMFRKFIKLRAKGVKRSEICRDVGISDKTFKKWEKIDENEEVFITLPRNGGRHRKTSDEENHNLRALALNQNWDNTHQLRQSEVFSDNVGLSSVCDRTISRRLKEQGVRRRVAAIKERLRESHKRLRLSYANEMANWNNDDWSRVIFIDEFRISTGDRGRVYVWREKGTRYEEKNIRLVNHTFRFNVSFIVFFSFRGLGDLCVVENLNKESYADFLEEYVMPFIEKENDDGIVRLLHDKLPAHKSHFVKDWINENIGYYEDFVLPHPSLSSDLNPTEQVGKKIKEMVRKQRSPINSRDDLLCALRQAHTKLQGVSEKHFFIKLVESMPRRLQAVRTASGGYTKY